MALFAATASAYGVRAGRGPAPADRDTPFGRDRPCQRAGICEAQRTSFVSDRIRWPFSVTEPGPDDVEGGSGAETSHSLGYPGRTWISG